MDTQPAPSQAITVRRMAFDYPHDLDPAFMPEYPEEACMFVGLSLLLPYLEPYLIRTMRIAKKELTDPVLIDGLSRFSAQEGQHYREHARFNEAVRGRNNDALLALEAGLKADYQRFSKERSLRFNLAYAEGFEAMTAATALLLMEERGQRGIPAQIEELMIWHALEELEHRTVAFDIYNAVCGGYLYRLAVGLFAQLHLSLFVYRATVALIRADPTWDERFGQGTARRLFTLFKRATFKIFPRLFKSWLPWYNPRNIAFGDDLQALSQHYTQLARSTS